jgi:hypothetical protein
VALYNLVDSKRHGRWHVNRPPHAFKKRRRHDKAKQLKQEEGSNADGENARQPTMPEAEAASYCAYYAHPDIDALWVDFHTPVVAERPELSDPARETRGL